MLNAGDRHDSVSISTPNVDKLRRNCRLGVSTLGVVSAIVTSLLFGIGRAYHAQAARSSAILPAIPPCEADDLSQNYANSGVTWRCAVASGIQVYLAICDT